MPLLVTSAIAFLAMLLMLLLAFAEVIPTNNTTVIPFAGSAILFELGQLASAYFVYQTATKQYGWSVALMIALSVVLGIIGWVVQIWFFLFTSENLRRRGLTVGFWGVDKEALSAFAAREDLS